MVTRSTLARTKVRSLEPVGSASLISEHRRTLAGGGAVQSIAIGAPVDPVAPVIGTGLYM
jgi:hypothetical protein